MAKKVQKKIIDGMVQWALLVIDVQNGLFNKSTSIYKADELMMNINELVDKAHLKDIPVVYIQHSNPTTLVYGSNDWRLHAGLEPEKRDYRIHKQHGNSFEETSLGQLLDSKSVNSLVVTGLVTHGCVKATCLGALELGYDVVLVKDAHSNYSNEAVELIEKWNNKLSGLGAQLIATNEINF
jgi:nicotinamidase-related amidase